MRLKRQTGRPTSTNGASSMHTWWVMPPSIEAKAIEIDLSISEAPRTPDLYFWAVQASFSDGAHRLGAGHLGLQRIDGYPGATAVNWGGYKDQSLGGGTLDGTTSQLPSALQNPHTRNYAWTAGASYRLRIERGEHGWRGSVYDHSRGETTIVRELLTGGTSLANIVMWSEVFAPCEGPSTTARWSNAVIIDQAGTHHQVTSFRTNYQRVDDGGCSNTSIEVDGGSVLQRTATPRVHASGSTLTVQAQRT